MQLLCHPDGIMPNSLVVMVGPSPKSRGGIASVVGSYEQAGLFEKWPIVYLSSHVEGSKKKKLRAAYMSLTIFLRLLLSRRAKLLHVHVARRTSFWRKAMFIILAYSMRCPVFVHLHSGGFPDFYWKECGPIKKRIVRFILDRADRLIVLSSQWWELLSSITKNARITKIPNFIVRTQGENLFRRENNSVLFLGRLSEEKGFFDLMEAAALITRRVPDFKLRCGGEGDIASIKAYIEKLGIQRTVDLLGWVGDDERCKLLDSSAIFVLPSYVEGLPMSVIEAMSKAIPVVASSVGGIPDVIEDGKDGKLIFPGDIKGIADALIDLLDDAAMRARMGQAGKKTVERRFTADNVLPILESMYVDHGIRPKDFQGIEPRACNDSKKN